MQTISRKGRPDMAARQLTRLMAGTFADASMYHRRGLPVQLPSGRYSDAMGPAEWQRLVQQARPEAADA